MRRKAQELLGKLAMLKAAIGLGSTFSGNRRRRKSSAATMFPVGVMFVSCLMVHGPPSGLSLHGACQAAL